MSEEQKSKLLCLPVEGDYLAASRNGRHPQKVQLYIHLNTTACLQSCGENFDFSLIWEVGSRVYFVGVSQKGAALKISGIQGPWGGGGCSD